MSCDALTCGLLVIRNRNPSIPCGAKAGTVIKPGHMHKVIVDGHADVITAKVVHAAASGNAG